MSLPARSAPPSLLLYEPRSEGHHPVWLRLLTEDLLSAGHQLTLAVNHTAKGFALIQEQLGDLLKKVRVLPATDAAGRARGGSHLRSLELCLRESGAPCVFMGAVDEIASAAFRRAAFGWRPSRELAGRIGGIFHRPRFLETARWSFNSALKRVGFRRLLRADFFRQLVLLDEYLTRDLQATYPSAPLFFLPGPCIADAPGDRFAARAKLGLPDNRAVLLFFGVGSRRKGLHLAVEALQKVENPATFLLCAGRLQPTPPVQRGLDQLQSQGRALVLDRYVSTAEEKLCFDACDIVLLPYVNHFGTSAVLFRAAAAGRRIIASDEQLLGRLVRDHELGLLFPSGDATALAASIRAAAAMPATAVTAGVAQVRKFAERYSRDAFRSALLASVSVPSGPPNP